MAFQLLKRTANDEPGRGHLSRDFGLGRLVSAHPDTPDTPAPDDLDRAWLAPLVESLGLAFVAVDLVLRADGVWRVVELGDGQVSDRPSSADPAAFVAAILPEVS